jgi:uncharacterized protein (TIGR02118 family)
MIKLTALYGKPQNPEAFERYYVDIHTPIALKIKGMRRYEIAKVSGTADGSSAPYYRTADIYFDDLQALQVALESAEGRATAADLANFATGGVTLMICESQDLLSK